MNKNGGMRQAAATASILLCSSIYMFYVTARSVVLPTIMAELNAMAYYSVTVILSSLTMAMIMPLAGKLGDLYGRKRIYLLGLIGYCAALAICALAVNLPMLWLGIALSGITYGFAYSQSLALMTNLYGDDVRAKILSYSTACSALTSLLGPVVGGFFADLGQWRMTFFVMIPFAVISVLLTIVGIPHIEPGARGEKVDALGVAFFMGTIAPVLYLFSTGGKQYAWASATTAILLGVAAVCGALLAWQEKRAATPIVPLHLLSDKVYRICLLVSLVYGLLYSVSNYLPIFYQAVRSLSSTVTGTLAMPRQIASVSMSLLMGAYLSKKGSFRKGMAIPLALFVASTVLFALWGTTTPFILLAFSELLYGMANGGISITYTTVGQSYLRAADMGVGMAFISFTNTLGNSLGSALTGCVVNGLWNVRKLLPAELYEALGSDAAALANSTTLNDAAALGAMKAGLPGSMQPLFDQGIASIRAAVDTGVGAAALAGAAMSLALLVLVLRFPWSRYFDREVK